MTRPVSPDAAIAAVVERVRPLRGTVWIGVDGKGASGKTSWAHRLAAVLPGAVVISIDDFARPGLRGWDRDRFAAQLLDPIRAGVPARYQRWDFDADRGTDWVQVRPGSPLIVEGVSATDARLDVPWAVTVWLDAPPAVRLARARARDGEAMMERWLTDWIPSEDRYEAEQQPQRRVDLIVDGG